MIRKLFQTENDMAGFFLRLLLGIVFLPHGAQKVFGWFGGHGFSATMEAFTVKAHIPAVLAFAAIMAESAGAVALILGFLTRIAAFALAVNMIVCASFNHVKNGFFMNWFGNQQGEGFEYHVLVVAIAIALIIRGAGRWSIDRALSYKK